MEWAFDPGVIVGLVTIEGLYLRALRVLGRRRVRVPGKQIALWHLGMTLWVAGLLSPIHTLGEDLLCFHMAQHLLIADLAAPVLLAGVRNPVLMFMLPRDILVPLARARRARAAFRWLRQPLVAIPVYVVVLYGWHFSFAFEAAVEHPLIHALQHASFFMAGTLVWWPLIQPVPMRHRLTGMWTFAYIVAAKFGLAALGLYLTWTHTVVYTYYEHVPRIWGLSAIDDQNVGGAIMMVEQSIVLVVAFAILFVRMLLQSEEDERRRERFEDPAAVA